MDDGMCPDQLQDRADQDFSGPTSTGRSDLRDLIYRLRMDLITVEEMLDCDGVGGFTELRRIISIRLQYAITQIGHTP